MALAMHGCVRIGQDDALLRPTPLEKTKEQTDPKHWSFKKLRRSRVSWFTRGGLRYLKRCLQNDLPLAKFPGCFTKLIGDEVACVRSLYHCIIAIKY
jgi:hypothetical protein